MKIDINRFGTNFNEKTCFTHARAVILDSGFGIMTSQPLRLTGCDVFYGMYISKTYDGGKTWSELTPSKTLVRTPLGDGYEMVLCDATPIYHEKSGKIILIGQTALYLNDDLAPEPRRRYTAYAVYDGASGDFTPPKRLFCPAFDSDDFYSSGNGSGQSCVLDNGELLIPIYTMDKKSASDAWHSCARSQVIRCAFDGEELTLLEIGAPLFLNEPRGFLEPSVIRYRGEYFLTLRNDKDGYITKSRDGLNYDDPKHLVWEGGESVGNYHTQQHLITGGGKLYLVYTRRGADNDHIPRHRAPLFIAEINPETLALKKETEEIVVPERGARLGNFGVQSRESLSDAFVVVSEWMQTTEPDPYDYKKCMKYGSDNSIFVTHITFNK